VSLCVCAYLKEHKVSHNYKDAMKKCIFTVNNDLSRSATAPIG